MQLPIEGMGLLGYDNNRRLYVGCHADSLNTHLLTYTGAADPDGRRFTYYGEMDEPSLGVVGRMVKYDNRVIDDDTFVLSIADLHVSPDYKVVEVTYRRR